MGQRRHCKTRGLFFFMGKESSIGNRVFFVHE